MELSPGQRTLFAAIYGETVEALGMAGAVYGQERTLRRMQHKCRECEMEAGKGPEFVLLAVKKLIPTS